MGAVLDVFPELVTDEMNGVLVREVDKDEIMKAVYDGFNGVFYQKYWEIVKDCVVTSYKSFFSHNCRMLRELNSTSITLVPKVKYLEDVAQFRPISCCNFGYKIISKV